MKKLSIAIPTYNREKYLADCLESLRSQSFRDFNVVIFDNASEYDIDAVISTFPELDITLLRSSSNTGSGGNTERIKNYDFRSEYLMVFHDDDTMRKDYLKDAMEYLNTNNQILWLGSNLSFVHENNEMLDYKSSTSKKGFKTLDTDGLLSYLLKDFDLQFGSVIYKTHLFQTTIMPFELFDKWSDRPFLVNLSKGGLIAITEDKYINYRIHKGQDSSQSSDRFDKLLNLFKYYKENSLHSPSLLKAFYLWSTNQSINTSASFSNSLSAFISYMKKFRSDELMPWSYIRTKGVYYFLRFLIKMKKK